MFRFKPSRVQIAVCIGLVLIGAVAAWIVWPRKGAVVVEERTDQQIEDLKNQVSLLSERVSSLSDKAQRKVVIVREEVRIEVADLSPDDVCSALNSELASFREVRACPGGADGNGD